jgi:archaellum component FlaD/FlaE
VNNSQNDSRTSIGSDANRNVEVVNQPDLVTVVMLGQWLDRAIAAVGKTETEKIIEMYDITGNMPVQMKQTLLLIIDSYGHNGKSTRKNNRNSIGLTSLSLLMEMDSLLRYRNRALEAAVLSLLAERESQQKKEQESKQSRQNKESQVNEEAETVGAFYG